MIPIRLESGRSVRIINEVNFTLFAVATNMQKRKSSIKSMIRIKRRKQQQRPSLVLAMPRLAIH